MPYKNIVFVKMEKRLLNDHRWFGMSEQAQLFYVKLILGCAETNNRLPLDHRLLAGLLRVSWKEPTIERLIKEIQSNFPKFKKDVNFYYFEDFHEKTNYIRDCPSSAQIFPKDGVDKEKEEDKEKDTDLGESNEKLYAYFSSCLYPPKLLEKEFITELIEKFGYKKTKLIIRQFAEGNFRRLATMKDALNPDGTLKAKGKETGTTITYNPPK